MTDDSNDVWRENITEISRVECPLCGSDVNRDDFADHFDECDG